MAVQSARTRMSGVRIVFIGEPQRDGTAAWNHDRGPDGEVYEIRSPDRASGTASGG